MKDKRTYIERYGKDTQVKRIVPSTKPLRGGQGRVGLGNSSWDGAEDPDSFTIIWTGLVSCYLESCRARKAHHDFCRHQD